ncbi:MAG: mechanosensitive ion channel [Alphaproteobacteria bacterium]|nr:mechanosensitive ion channel [Alphaproteobacteria bacterium]
MEDLLSLDTWIVLGRNALILTTAVLAAKLAQWLLLKLLRSQRLFHGVLLLRVTERIAAPMGWLFIFLAFYAALPLTQVPDLWVERVQAVLKPVSVACLGWLVVNAAHGVEKWLEAYGEAKQARDNLSGRRFTTQIHVLMRVVVSVLILLTVIGMALVIPTLREFGMSLFASAGVAGIVLGIAAKESFSNIIAGVQLALTQQILLGDEVVVQNQFGTVEEITSSYVAIKTWDKRRLIVPLRFFMENAFENWTYHDPDIIGAAYLYADYTVDVAKARREAEHIVSHSPYWDGKTFNLQVTASKEEVVELRIIASAANSSDSWNLRCELREKMVAYLQRAQASSLPKRRVLLDPESALAQQQLMHA